ncbi:MAG: complex I NDUFA9 subunit family protein [Hyphomicrobiaceae bacterium]|nr:complex I NDUFA9 subunit family protein [Hyphomicrobiaceae bacterium]
MTDIAKDRLATVIGGSGFVGRYAVRALARDGWRVRAACRRPDLAGYLQPMGRVGQIHPVQANLRYPESLTHAVRGAETVITSVGVLASVGRQSFEAIHVDGPRAAAKAAREAGVRRFIHVSAIGADAQSNARYARTKAAGEAAVREAFPGAIILRPSIVFGPEDQFFNRFAAMARMSPLLPLIGGGRNRFQPIYVADLADAIAAAAAGAGTPGIVYEIGGPEVLSFRQLLDKTQHWAGRDRSYFPMPFWLAKLQAILTWPLPNGLRPVTVDQVRMLQRDTIVSEHATAEGRTIAALGITHPESVDAIVPTYLERFKAKGQYAHYRG